MPNDRAARPVQHSASIHVPDQLQQAKQPDTHRASDTVTARQAGRDEPKGGILHELKTDRAHD